MEYFKKSHVPSATHWDHQHIGRKDVKAIVRSEEIGARTRQDRGIKASLFILISCGAGFFNFFIGYLHQCIIVFTGKGFIRNRF